MLIHEDKKKFKEGYLTMAFLRAMKMLKQLDVVEATYKIAVEWRESSCTIIQNYFCKASFKYLAVDPE